MSRHTAGPWSLSAGYHKTVSGEPADWTIEGGPHGNAIAFLSDDNAGPRYERDANARLIAAAPDLLEALKYCRDLLEDVNGFDYRPDDVAANEWAAVRAAIAKAEGK
jgi:hypothetical protein